MGRISYKKEVPMINNLCIHQYYSIFLKCFAMSCVLSLNIIVKYPVCRYAYNRLPFLALASLKRCSHRAGWKCIECWFYQARMYDLRRIDPSFMNIIISSPVRFSNGRYISTKHKKLINKNDYRTIKISNYNQKIMKHYFLHFLLNIKRTFTVDRNIITHVNNESFEGSFFLKKKQTIAIRRYLAQKEKQKRSDPLGIFKYFPKSIIYFSYNSNQASEKLLCIFSFIKIPINTLIQLNHPVTCLNECFSQLTLQYFYSTFCELEHFLSKRKAKQLTKFFHIPKTSEKYSFHPFFIFFSVFNLKFSTLGIMHQIFMNFKKGYEKNTVV
ncbi:hypothetical protein VP01_798g1 [Puccinia sorghi]|uniref:Uncharacterized protein n=1 Tax=Puccinia sorghi TaxID=27349 RepID=A0A0L6UAQ7_9BASI|nr:hypothetical protein VP01_798g1 [Puccinia sorghi]